MSPKTLIFTTLAVAAICAGSPHPASAQRRPAERPAGIPRGGADSLDTALSGPQFTRALQQSAVARIFDAGFRLSGPSEDDLMRVIAEVTDSVAARGDTPEQRQAAFSFVISFVDAMIAESLIQGYRDELHETSVQAAKRRRCKFYGWCRR